MRKKKAKTATSVDLMFAGLNIQDRERIKKIGYAAWLDETCEAQMKRLKERKRIGSDRVSPRG